MIKLYNCDCLDYINSDEFKNIVNNHKVVIITDPPFNIGYHYNEYKDNLKTNEYLEMLKKVLTTHDLPFVLVHYAEMLYQIAFKLGIVPTKVVSWVYNSNTAKQHRDIAFFKIKPNFNQVKQPYKNPNDKRIRERIKNGSGGGRLYDWWNVNQVKNVSKKGIDHPCVMPLKVLENIVGILPTDVIIFDPFMGSGTTGLACKNLNRDFIGCEINADYYELAKERINNE